MENWYAKFKVVWIITWLAIYIKKLEPIFISFRNPHKMERSWSQIDNLMRINTTWLTFFPTQSSKYRILAIQNYEKKFSLSRAALSP